MQIEILFSLFTMLQMMKNGSPKRSSTSVFFSYDHGICKLSLVGWLVVGVKRQFETVFQSILGHLPKRGRKRRERIEESKNVQTTPTRTYCKCSRPLPYSYPN